MATTASAAAGTVSYPSHMMEALREVAALEPGAVLNDHYDIRRYVDRRTHYLDTREDHQDPSLRLFQITRGDAARVFAPTSTELSVQEIRRRELQQEIRPLLPLPTTGNTETIDNFQSLPPVEWTQGSFFDGNMTAPTLPQSQVNSAAGPSTGPFPSSLHNSQPYQHQASSSTSNLVYPDLNIPGALVSSSTNNTMATNPPQQTTGGYFPDTSSPPFPDISLASSYAMNRQSSAPTSPPSMLNAGGNGDKVHTARAPPPFNNPALLPKWIADNLGKRNQAPAATADSEQQGDVTLRPVAQQTVYYPEGVAALKNGPMRVPVKPQKRGKDYAAEEDDAGEDNNEQIEDGPSAARAPPRKRMKKDDANDSLATDSNVQVEQPQAYRGRKKPTQKATLITDEASETEEPPPKRAKKGLVKLPLNEPGPAEKKGAPKKSTQKSTTHIENIASGHTLPRTKAEAQTASTHRLTTLLNAHNTTLKHREKATIPKPQAPDFMPEHFNPALFPDEDQVRCVCGVMHDDHVEMIACDGCGVWQHNRCVREALPEDVEVGEYFCQVCDPWTHREGLARLRRGRRVV